MTSRRRLLLTLPWVLLAGAACRGAVTPTSAARPLTYVAIGASDSVGVGAGSPDQESWPAVLQRRLPAGSRLVNLGVSGSLIRQAVDQQLPVALDSDPDLVTVWLAVNDYGARVPLPRYASDLDLLLQTLRSQTRATILVGNVPDLSVLPVAARFDLKDVDRWNNAIAELSRRHGAVLVDLRQAYAEVAQHPEYISSDGFHPSTTGYQRLADLFYASAVEPLGLATGRAG
ncbi:MAG: SGNH/GDSL hydrolase family protein [Chloroflexi bacterium]|nr:SGNH/GDSL hydrolase family protein [Chloroflexota bacterium]